MHARPIQLRRYSRVTTRPTCSVTQRNHISRALDPRVAATRQPASRILIDLEISPTWGERQVSLLDVTGQQPRGIKRGQMKFNAAINSGGGGKSRKLQTACAYNGLVHTRRACSHLRRVYERHGASTAGTPLAGSYIVLVLIYATQRAFLLPRYRDLSAANYTFTPVAAGEHQTDPRGSSRPPVVEGTRARRKERVSHFLPLSPTFAPGGFFPSKAVAVYT